jgi:hypothetical protein
MSVNGRSRLRAFLARWATHNKNSDQTRHHHRFSEVTLTLLRHPSASTAILSTRLSVPRPLPHPTVSRHE